MSSWAEAQDALPLWLAREDESYWFGPLEDVVFVQFSTVATIPTSRSRTSRRGCGPTSPIARFAT